MTSQKPAGAERSFRLRLTDQRPDQSAGSAFKRGFTALVARRQKEADAFFDAVIPPSLGHAERTVMRQALVGLMRSKYFYHFVVKTWLQMDAGMLRQISGVSRPLPPLFPA